MANIKFNSEEYKEDYEAEFDAPTVEQIRSNINEWSNNIPYQPFSDFGNEIEIKQTDVLWLYRAELSTEFDIRSVAATTVPYQNQPLPDFRNDCPERVNLWEPRLQTTDRYANVPIGCYTVDHSQTVSVCGTCNGTGEEKCPDCHGTGSHRCTTCEGSGKVPHIQTCYSCYGKGYTVTYTEKTLYRYENGKAIPCGIENVPHRHTCTGCKGTGKVQHGYDRCGACNGHGRIQCHKCRGKGKITCSTCKGCKKLYHYLYISQKLEYAYRKLHNVDIPDADFYPIIKELLDEECYEHLDSYFSGTGALQGDYSVLPFVGESAMTLLNEKHAMEDGGRHILFETLRITRTGIIRVDYAYDGTDYTLYVTKNNKVSASHSPVSVYTESLKNKAVRQAKKRMLCSADRNFEKLYYITRNNAFWDMSESIATKMHNDVRFGSNIALVMLTVLLFPLASYYLDNVSWVAPWIDLGGAAASWTWGCLPYLYTAAVIFGGYKISRLGWWHIYEHTPSLILRMLLGAVQTTLGVAGCAAALLLAHFIVLPAVWQTAGQVVLLPWNIIMGILGILF